MKTGNKLGIVALALAIATAVLWFYMAGYVGIPENRTGFVIVFVGAAALGVFAFVKGTSLVGALPPVVAILIGAFLTMTIYISPQALDSARSITVGDTIPHFTAPDGNGETFDSAALHGHLVLIKFFRAHW